MMTENNSGDHPLALSQLKHKLSIQSNQQFDDIFLPYIISNFKQM